MFFAFRVRLRVCWRPVDAIAGSESSPSCASVNEASWPHGLVVLPYCDPMSPSASPRSNQLACAVEHGQAPVRSAMTDGRTGWDAPILNVRHTVLADLLRPVWSTAYRGVPAPFSSRVHGRWRQVGGISPSSHHAGGSSQRVNVASQIVLVTCPDCSEHGALQTRA